MDTQWWKLLNQLRAKYLSPPLRPDPRSLCFSVTLDLLQLQPQNATHLCTSIVFLKTLQVTRVSFSWLLEQDCHGTALMALKAYPKWPQSQSPSPVCGLQVAEPYVPSTHIPGPDGSLGSRRLKSHVHIPSH